MLNDPKYGNDPSLGPVNGATPTASGTITITNTSELDEFAFNIGRVKSIKVAAHKYVTLKTLGNVEELNLRTA